MIEVKTKLMILEDDEPIQKIYYSVFSKTDDFDVVICKNDNEFFSALAQCQFELFLIDLELGNSKNGLEIIKELRQMEKYKSVPIIVVTAYASKRDENECLHAGATKFFRKPFDFKILLNEFRKLKTQNDSEIT